MRAPRPRRLPARGLVPLAVAALVFGVRYDADAAARHKGPDGVLIEHAEGLPDLQRGRQAAAEGRLEDAEADLKPLAERGYVDAQIALGKLYAKIGTPERIRAAIGWLRTAHERTPEPVEVPLGRLLLRQQDDASLTEGEALLSAAWERNADPDALTGLIRLYSEHPERDTQQRIGALIVRGETIRVADVQGAVIGWYRSTPQIDGHRDKVVKLCAQWLDEVPECYVDLAAAARRGGDTDYLKDLAGKAAQRYDGGVVPAQTLASLARVMVEALDDDDDEAAVVPASLPVKISDVPENEGAAADARPQTGGAAQGCAIEAVSNARDVPTASGGSPAVAQSAPAAPALANMLLTKLLDGPADAPVLAAGVIARYPYLVPGADVEAALKRGLARGVPEARLYLGQLYLVGARGAREPQLALQYLQQATQEPSTALQAHYYLGRLYQYGYLDESRPLLAAEHLMWAARRGYPAADSALARLFSNGKGVCPNLVNAYVFASLSAREGSASTAALQQRIGARLTPEQRAEAERTLNAEMIARPSAYEIPQTMLAREADADAAAVDAGAATPTLPADAGAMAAAAPQASSEDAAAGELAAGAARTDTAAAMAPTTPTTAVAAAATDAAVDVAPEAPAEAAASALPSMAATPAEPATPSADAGRSSLAAAKPSVGALDTVVTSGDSLPASSTQTDESAAPPLAAAAGGPTLTFSKTLSFIVPVQQPSVDIPPAAAAAAEPAPTTAQAEADSAVPAIAATPTAPVAESAPIVVRIARPQGEIRLSHRPSEDPALRALMQSDPKVIEYTVPAQQPAPHGGHEASTEGPAPAAQVIPSGEKS